MTTRAPGRGPTPSAHDPAVEDWASRRRLWLDNLKVLLIAGIIAGHAISGYSSLDVWSYGDVRETTLSPGVEIAMIMIIAPFAMFLISLLFLVAGLLTPGSVERKGTGGFARDRLLRLGVPFAVYVFVVQPTLLYALYHPFGNAPGSFWYEYLGEERQLDTGPLWFAGVLLIYSLAYAAWVRVRRDRPPRRTPPTLTVRHLLLIVLSIAPLSFLIRLVYPYGSDSGFTDLNLWQWPACIATFAIGVIASRQGWLTDVPDRLRRQSRAVTLAAVVGFGAMVGLMIALDEGPEHMFGGAHWPAVAFAVLDALLTVFGAVWLLAAAQRHLERRLRWVGPAAARSAYAAFFLQTPVLIGVAVALRPVPVPAEVKALVVAVVSVAVSFWLAWLLIRKVPGVRRVL